MSYLVENPTIREMWADGESVQDVLDMDTSFHASDVEIAFNILDCEMKTAFLKANYPTS